MTSKTFAFARPSPDGVEVCIVVTGGDAEPARVACNITPRKALELAHEITRFALEQMRARGDA